MPWLISRLHPAKANDADGAPSTDAKPSSGIGSASKIAFTKAPSPVYGESGVTLRYYTFDLFWRPLGRLVRFVWVIHPSRGRLVLLCTDLTLPPLDIIRLYGWRFKIEVSFKQAIHTLGAYAYISGCRT